jgi:hypothetical protein
MRYSSLVLLFVIAILANCSNNKGQDEADASAEQGDTGLEADVNRIHDEVMPRMGELYKLKKKLQQRDTAASTTPAEKTKINAAIQKLDSAYEGMMNWMHQFKPEEHQVEEKEAREYLEGELEKIKKVKKDMLAAIETGRTLVGEQ